MAKLSDSKIFYLQAFTILALVCLPGNIFTAVLLYLQHFSTTTTTAASTTTTITITDNVTFEGSLTLNDDETSENDISSTNLSFVDRSSNLFLLSSDLEEKVSTETDTISELEGSRKNFSSISQSQEQTTDDNSRIEKAKLKNGNFLVFHFCFVFPSNQTSNQTFYEISQNLYLDTIGLCLITKSLIIILLLLSSTA
jgi:hypothetical protein